MKKNNLIKLRHQPLPKEAEITKNWKSTSAQVSVICFVYNHADFLHDCLRGILSQKTPFPFEIIIHDDASTDNSQEIIAQYAELYPRLITPILQLENQFSQGKRPLEDFIKNRLQSTYIALCEGDDFWVRSDKIASQVALLNTSSNVHLCIHPSYTLNMAKNEYINVLKSSYHGRHSKILPYSKVYSTRGQFSATASMVMHRSIFNTLPNFYYTAPIGDFFFEALAGVNGVLYWPEHASVYRLNAKGSWTERVLNHPQEAINFYQQMQRHLDLLTDWLTTNHPKSRHLPRIKQANIQQYQAALLTTQGELWTGFKLWLESFQPARWPNKTDVRYWWSYAAYCFGKNRL